MKAKVPVSDLLAHRDGEALDALRAAQIEEDTQAKQTLLRLRMMKQSLNELPTLEPEEVVWQAVLNGRSSNQSAEAKTLSSSPSYLRSFFLGSVGSLRGLAVGVFIATAIGVVLWFPAPSEVMPQITDSRSVAPIAPVPPVDLLYTAQLRSQNLENQVNNRSMLANNQLPTQDQQAIVYAITQLDGELNRIAFEEPDNRDLRERLWQRRVALLESLVAVQQGSSNIPASYY